MSTSACLVMDERLEVRRPTRNPGTTAVKESPEAGPQTRFASRVILVGAADAFKGLRFLVLLFLMTRLLGAEGYGIWTQVKVSSTFLASIASLGMAKAMFRYLSGERRGDLIREQVSSIFWMTVAASAAILAALTVWAESIAAFVFRDPVLTPFVFAIGIYLFLEAADQLATTFLQVTLQMYLHTAWVVVELVGEILIVWGLASSGVQLAGVVFGLVAWKGAVLLSKLALVWYQVGIGPPRLAEVGRYLSVGLPLLASGLAYLIANYGDRYFIGLFLGIGAVGMYAAAYAVGSLPAILAAPIDYVLYPAIAIHWNSGRMPEVRRHVELCLQWLTIVLMPTTAALLTLGEPLMLTIATEEFRQAVPAASIVAAAFSIFAFGVIGERVLVLADRTRTVTFIYCSVAVVNSGLNVALIPRLGLMGSALATLVSFLLYTTLTLTRARRHCPISMSTSILWKSALAALGATLAVYPWVRSGAGSVLLAVAVGAVIYLLILAGLRAVRFGGPGGWIEVRAVS